MRLSTYLTRLIWLCVMPLVVFSAWLVYDIVGKLQEAKDQEAGYIATNFATAIDQHLNARIGSLKVMASSPLVDDPALWPIYYKVAQGFRDTFGSHVILTDVGEPMRMLFNTRAPFGSTLPFMPKPKSNAAAPKVLATGQPAVSDIFIGPVAKESLVALAVPIRRHDKILNILVATFEIHHFQARLEQVVLPTGWGLYLLDGKGDVIAHRPSTKSDSASQEDAYRRIDVNLTVAPWSVRLEIPRDIYRAHMLGAVSALGLAILLVALIGLGGGLWGTRRLGKAVASLAEPNHKPAAGLEIVEISAARHLIDEATERIASFAAMQDRAIEQERRRVAREVHDQLGQVFTAIKLIIQSIPRDAYPTEQEAALHQALEMGIASARKITAELRPPLLDDLGLGAALDHFGKGIAKSANLTIEITLRDDQLLSTTNALVLFRIAQEAVTNILRHAGASRISMTGRSEAGNYLFKIEDNGKGFEPGAVRKGAMGLISMRERASLLGGEFAIAANPAGGTTIKVSMPLKEAGSHEHYPD